MSMRDSNAKGRIYLQVNKDDPLINLRDKSDKGGIFINVSKEGPMVWFKDEEGRTTYAQR